MGKSLYRSYRSKSFDEIIGQDHITTVLKNALKSDSVSHAYLLSGPRGVGKTSTARILAHAVNEISYEGENINLDIIEIDAASNRRIDEVREIRERVYIAPVAGKYKVYIIDEVHMLTKEAFNALLKTLEEPPAHAIFILATTESHKIPETILSRCIKLNFKPIENDALSKHLKNIAKNEKIEITDEAIDVIAVHGRGSFRDAISLLEQVKFTNDKIDVDDVNMMLGMASEVLIDQIISSISIGDLKGIRDTLQKAYESGASESILTSQIAEKFRELIIDTSSPVSKSKLLMALKELLAVAGSSNPRIELELCLSGLVIDDLPISQNASKTEQSINVEIPKVKTPKVKELYIGPGPIAIPGEPKIVVSQKNVENNDVWAHFLSVLKKQNTSLYGIARMADVTQDNDTIELGFKFAFHYKQVNNPKNRQIFNEIMSKISKDSPKIVISHLGENKKPKNDTLKNLSNIFGTHEVLES